MRIRTILQGVLLMTLAACSGGAPTSAVAPARLTVDRQDDGQFKPYLRDAYGRYVFFHGVNVSGSTKVPAAVGGRPLTLDQIGETLQQGVPSYLGLPFPGHTGKAVDAEEIAASADAEFRKLKAAGFNAVRLLLNWEGIEPVRKGEYDREYLKSIRTVVEAANRHGIYVLLDMHQDSFSRHLVVRYNETPSYEDPPGSGNVVHPAPGTIENTLLALVGPYTDAVRGEGAPRWVVETCLPEKKLDSPFWGTPRLLRVLNQLSFSDLTKLGELLGGFLGSGEGGSAVPAWALALVAKNPGPFEPYETTDALPFTNWGIMSMLSLDVARCFFCLFASEAAFPGLTVTDQDGKVRSAQDYLQEAYANAWKEVATVVADLPNVAGYDLMNEPNTNAIPLTAVAALLMTGAMDAAHRSLIDLLGRENGDLIYNLLTGLGLLPPLPSKPAAPDPPCETRADAVAKKTCEEQYQAALAQYEADRQKVLHDYGLDRLDPIAIAGFNYGFDRTYLKPFYERVGKAILEVDPDAVFFIESSLNISTLLSGITAGMWDVSMDRLDLPRVVYAPHWYADIYPFLGFNQPDREFQVEEVRYRDYEPSLRAAEALAAYSLGNVPVAFGEFGTYFKFGGIDRSVAEGYLVSAHILDNYYEALERMFRSRFVWCYTPDNDRHYGDWWNKEDFSIQGFDREFRAREAWARPFPKALAGRPISMHYYSPLHYFDLNDKEVPPVREFEVRYDVRETSAPTEVSIPDGVYPDGFYVWLSDGFAYFDPQAHTLYHYADRDEPGAEHFIRIRAPLPGQPNVGWRYFFRGDQVVRAY